MSQFQQPAASNPEDKIDWAELKHHLLLFFPHEIVRQIATKHGESDAVKARVVDLNTGRVFNDTLIFPMALRTQLSGAVPDGMVLGRLNQGANTKGNPPWLLDPHTADDVRVAEGWIAANPVNQFAQPQQQAAPPTPPAYGQQATPAWQPQGGQGNAPAAWQNAGAPAASAPAQSPGAPSWQGAPAAAAPAAPAADIPPHIAAGLAAKGVNVAGMSAEQAQQIAAMLGVH